MDVQTLKYEIIEWITRTSDNSLLETLKSIKDSSANSDGDWFEKLNRDEVDSINRGIEDHQKGKTLKSKDFWAGYGD